MKSHFFLTLCVFFICLFNPVNNVSAQSLSNEPKVIKIRSDQTLLINGKPFLPNGFYITGNDPLGALNKIAAAGFNLVHANGKKSTETREFLDRAAILGVYAIIENDEDPLSMVYEYKNHSALLGYTLVDDANLKSRGETLKEINEKVKKVDSNHMTFIPIAQMKGDSAEAVHMKTYFNCTDLIGEELYPFGHPWWRNQNIKWNEDALVRDFQWAKPYNQPVWALPQTFAWNDYTPPPTALEIRNQYYVSLINGVKGFIGFAFSWTQPYDGKLWDSKTLGYCKGYDWQLDKSEPLWREVQKVNAELKQLTLVLLDGKRTKYITGNPDLAAAYWEYENKIYLFIANISEQHLAQDVSLVIPDGVGQPRPLFSERPEGLEFKDSKIRGIIQPTDVHCYIFNRE